MKNATETTTTTPAPIGVDAWDDEKIDLLAWCLLWRGRYPALKDGVPWGGELRLFARELVRAALASAAQPSECGNCFEGKSDLDRVCLVCSGTGYVATAPKAAPAPTTQAAPTAVAEPVAWLHDDPQRYDVIHAEVKDLLVKSRDAAIRAAKEGGA